MKAEGVGLRLIALDQGVNRRPLPDEAAVEPSHVDACGLYGVAHGFFRRASPANGHHSVVSRLVFPLIPGREREPRAIDRGHRENGPVLVDEADFAVGRDDAPEVRRSAFCNRGNCNRGRRRW